MSEFITPAQVEEASAAVGRLLDIQPMVGLILGSGLSKLAEEVESPVIISVDQIPHWPVCLLHSVRLKL